MQLYIINQTLTTMSIPVDHKYRWLLNQLMHARLTREEITDRWYDYSGQTLTRETFKNWKDAVEKYFDTIIECDTKDGYRYYIEDEHKEDIKRNTINRWILKTMEVSDTVTKHKQLKDRILVEEVPSGNETLEAILDAMESNHVVSFEYTKYFNNPEEKPEFYELCPYCVKQFERRWYVVGFCLTRNQMRTFSIDKIQKLEKSEKTFEMPKDFDSEAYFKPFFGIITGIDDKRMGKIKLEHIEIKVEKDRAKYFRSLPLHHTQQEKERTEDYTIFTFDLYPTNDFYQALLHEAEYVEVLAPANVRKVMKKKIQSMSDKYNRTK